MRVTKEWTSGERTVRVEIEDETVRVSDAEGSRLLMALATGDVKSDQKSSGVNEPIEPFESVNTRHS